MTIVEFYYIQSPEKTRKRLKMPHTCVKPEFASGWGTHNFRPTRKNVTQNFFG